MKCLLCKCESEEAHCQGCKEAIDYYKGYFKMEELNPRASEAMLACKCFLEHESGLITPMITAAVVLCNDLTIAAATRKAVLEEREP